MSAESPPQGSKAIVYVVDDDLSVREALERLLRTVGWKVETFVSAQEFLAYRKENIPSCLVLDVALPGSERARSAEAKPGGEQGNSDRFYHGSQGCSNLGARDESGGRRISG
jgi:hypothetical protein